MAVERRNGPTGIEEHVDELAMLLSKIESPTGRLLAWLEVKRQIVEKVFANDAACRRAA